MDRSNAGRKCRVIRHLATRDGPLRRDAQGTIQYEMDNLDRHLVFVNWDNGTNTPVFAQEIEIILSDVSSD